MNTAVLEAASVKRLELPKSEQPLSGDRAQNIVDALNAADLNALRMTLFQLTGNTELRDMPLETIPIRNGRVFKTEVHHDYIDRLKQIATEYLNNPGQDVPPQPTKAEQIELINTFAGTTVDSAMIPPAVSNLGMGEFPADVSDDLKKVRVPEGFHVTVVGAGASGIALGIYFKRLGIPYTIVERLGTFGGTWVANHYPHLRVDVAGLTYQFRFAYWHWKSVFPTDAEIVEYLEYVADSYNLAENTRFNTEVTDGEWDAKTSRWNIKLSDGSTLSSNFVVAASGLFGKANIAEIEGLKDFGGEVLHLAEWDDSFDPAGKSVALIGSGSSGTQVMPWLTKHSKNVVAFQRNPQWIVPPLVKYDTQNSPALHWLMDNLPYYVNWHVYAMMDVALKGQYGHELDPDWYAKHGTLSEHNELFAANLLQFQEEELEGRPDLIEKVRPNHTVLSRRLIVDAGWYKALKEPNAELVTDAISNVDKTGIKMKDGRHYNFDAIVLASGYDVTNFFFPVKYKGTDGATFADAWAKDGPRAYIGMTYNQFPNFFSCFGPNSLPRSGSFFMLAEGWATYISSVILKTIQQGATSATVTEEAFERYSDEVDERFEKLVFGVFPSGGYYIIDWSKRPGVHMPLRSEEYYTALVQPKYEDYRFE